MEFPGWNKVKFLRRNLSRNIKTTFSKLMRKTGEHGRRRNFGVEMFMSSLNYCFLSLGLPGFGLIPNEDNDISLQSSQFEKLKNSVFGRNNFNKQGAILPNIEL